MITLKIDKPNKCNGDYSIFVSFPYDINIINAIRELPTRYWINDTKEWEVPFKKLEDMIDMFSTNYEMQIITDYPQCFAEEEEIDIPDGFEFKTKPYNHQIEGFKYGLNHSKWLLGDEQGCGKALALDTKIYTPNGYKLMRDIQVGDCVFGKNGKPTKVTAVYNHSNVEMYRITFSDGVSIDCCKDHLWQIHDQHGTKVVDTQWFIKKDQFGRVRKDNLFSNGSGSYKYWIDKCEPIQFNSQDIPLDPYILGVLLGDGCIVNGVSLTTYGEEIVTAVNDKLPKGYYLNSSASMDNTTYNIISNGGRNLVKQVLKDMHLLGTNSHTKFIPDIYKYNSIDVRTQILQGLIDTDGYATKDNLLSYTTVSKQLCEDVRFLVESLGGLVSCSEKPCGYNGKITGISYTLTIKFNNPQEYCTLMRKKNLLKNRHFKTRRNIVSIERIENADAKCITVDNDDSLYVIDHFVVTHNTKQIIDIAVAEKLMQGCKHCLIVCGVNGLKWNWVNEVATHSNEKAYILGQKVRKNGNVVIGSMADRLADAEHIEDIEEYFIITNVETLRDERITTALSNQCKKGNIGMIAADEVHKMKNASSQQGKGFLKLSADRMIAMTGTPLMNHPLDLYIILKWLGYEKHSFYAFRNHHCVMGGFGGYEIVGYKNLDELQEQLNDIMLRRLKKDVLDLPEKTIVDEYVEMTPKQTKIYNEILNDIKDNIDQIAIAPNPLAQLIRLRQATGYTGILSSMVQESAKLDHMEELVDDAIENGQKVIIFSNWTQMTSAIKQRLQNKYYCAMITGELNTEARERAKDEFQNNPKCKVIIGTIGAMGTGLTLVEGSVMIFTDIPWNKALFDQAVDRFHRIGQNNNVTVYNLICKGTVDEKINAIVQQKGRMADYLVDGHIVGDKGKLIDYLLN